MKNKNELLHDVLQEAAPAEFRAALLADTLGQVRRRKVARQRNRAILSVAFVITLAISLWRFTAPERGTSSLMVHAPAVDPMIVLTKPMPRGMIVETKSGTLESVHTSRNTIALVKTPSKEILFKTIGDEELLTLLAGRPVLLVRPRPGQAELHFVNPEDSTELFQPVTYSEADHDDEVESSVAF